MKTTTIARILLGGAIILSCAVIPLWVTRASSTAKPETDLFVLPPDMSGPYESLSPAAVWLYDQQYETLSPDKDLKWIAGKTAAGLVPVLIQSDSKLSLPNQKRATSSNLLSYLRSVQKQNEIKKLVLPSGKQEKERILDDRHLLLQVRELENPEKFRSDLRGLLGSGVRIYLAEQWFRLSKPYLAASLQKTLAHVGKSGPYRTLNLGSLEFVDSKWIGIKRGNDGDLLSTLAGLPLAGSRRDLPWLSRSGFHTASADSIRDLGTALQKGDVSAGFLWKAPKDVPSAQLPVSGYLGIIFNMKSRVGERLHRHLKWRKMNPGKKITGRSPFSTPSTSVRILCRRSEGISRVRALSQAREWEKEGIQASVVLEGDSGFRSRIAKRDFDVVLGVFPVSVETDPGYWWLSNSPGNISGYGNKQLDSKIKKLNGSSGDKEILGEVRQILENGPWILLEEVTLNLCGSRAALRRLGFPATRYN